MHLGVLTLKGLYDSLQHIQSCLSQFSIAEIDEALEQLEQQSFALRALRQFKSVMAEETSPAKTRPNPPKPSSPGGSTNGFSPVLVPTTIPETDGVQVLGTILYNEDGKSTSKATLSTLTEVLKIIDKEGPLTVQQVCSRLGRQEANLWGIFRSTRFALCLSRNRGESRSDVFSLTPTGSRWLKFVADCGVDPTKPDFSRETALHCQSVYKQMKNGTD